jgi:hypothetical protein
MYDLLLKCKDYIQTYDPYYLDDNSLIECLENDDTLQIVVTNCNTGVQTKENWKFTFYIRKCISITKNSEIFTRCYNEHHEFEFINNNHGFPIKIRLYPYEAQTKGEIRVGEMSLLESYIRG